MMRETPISKTHSPLPTRLAIITLLATPALTALSRNIAFPMLLLSASLFAAPFVAKTGVAEVAARVMRSPHGIMARSPFGLFAFTFLLYSIASLSWAPEISRGLAAVLQVTLAATAAALSIVLVIRQRRVPAWLGWALPSALALASLLVIFELQLGSPFRTVFDASPEAFRLNRAAVAIALLSPILFLQERSTIGLVFIVLCFSLATIAIFLSQSESAKLAMAVIATTAAFSAVLRPQFLLFCVGFGVLASHVLAPVIALGLYRAITPDAVASLLSAFTQEAYHFTRLEIWWAYAKQIIGAPILGYGLQGSYWASETYSGDNITVLRGLSSTHPHNASIQIWYELGLIGVILSVALMVLMLRHMLRLPGHTMRITAILISGVWSIAFVSHGAWQAWWWALIGIVCLILLAAGRVGEKESL